MHTYALNMQAQSGQLVPQPVSPDLAEPRVRAFRAKTGSGTTAFAAAADQGARSVRNRENANSRQRSGQ